MNSTVTTTSIIGSLDDDSDISVALNACRTLAVALLTSTTWILLSAIVHGYKTKNMKNSSDYGSLDRRSLYICCVSAVGLTLPRLGFTCVMLFIPAESIADRCGILMDVSHGLYFCAEYPAYLFLWLRHRAIYCHPTVRKLAGKCVMSLSWILLITLSLMAVALTCLFIVLVPYEGSENGCLLSDVESGTNTWYYVLPAFLAFSQICLLALFIYPMIRCGLQQMQNRNRSATEVNPSNRGFNIQEFFRRSRHILCGFGENSGTQNNALGRTIRRSVLGTLIAILTDTSAMIIATFAISNSTPRSLVDTIYDLSTLVNSLSILATFGENGKILRAVCSGWKSEERPERKRYSSTTQTNVISV